MNAICYWLMNNPKAKGAWISPYHKQTQKVMEDIIDAVGEFAPQINRMDRRMTFANGSELLFLSAENYESIRGYTFDYMIMDEAAYIKGDALKVIRPTVAVNGKKVMIISTPYIKNWFYDYFQLGWNPEHPEYISFKAPSIANPYFPLAEIEAARETLSAEEIRQEYEAEFSDNAGGVFLGFEHLCVLDNFVGHYDDPCYLGVDIALGGKDNSCLVIMNGAGEVIYVDRWKESITEKQIKRILMTCDLFNIKRGNIEMNQERGIQQAISKHFPQIKPWETTRKSKPPMIQNLKKDIEDGVVAFPSRTLDPVLFHEFSNFTYEKRDDGYIKYGHPDGGHDDTVIAVALANEARVPNRHTRRNWMTDFDKWNK